MNRNQVAERPGVSSSNPVEATVTSAGSVTGFHLNIRFQTILRWALAILLFSFSHHPVKAGDITIPLPPGYFNSKLRDVGGIAVDDSNNIWIAYRQIGLAKYDASSWTIYDSLNSPFPSNRILSVACNASGVWAGTDTGLFHFNGINWSWMNTSNSAIPSNSVPKLYSPGGNDLYMFSNSGFSHFNGSTWSQYTTSNSNLVDDTVQCIYKDDSGILWIGTRHGLSSFNGTSWQNFTASNSNLTDDNILSLNEDGNHHLYIGATKFGLFVLQGNEILQISIYANSFYTFPRTIANMFRLHSGEIFLSFAVNVTSCLVETNPVKVTFLQDGFAASDTNHLAVIDNQERIWNYYFKGVPFFRMRDSIINLPLEVPSYYNQLDINEIKAGITNRGRMFQAYDSEYEVPKGEFIQALFHSAVWVSGKDSFDSLHIAADGDRNYSIGDFSAGPLDTIHATTDSLTMVQYDSIWKINRHEIDEFITQFDLGNVTNGSYLVPAVILSWPAHGQGNYSRDLAPFIDRDQDGIYNPYQGDYPAIKGDQFLWWIMNDVGHEHYETGGKPLGIEVHASAYAFNCPDIPDSNEVINYTTFYNYEFINRSDTVYNDVLMSIESRFKLGESLDDFIGCNPEFDFGFCYNADNQDGYSYYTYGINPPMMNCVLLNGPVADLNDSIDNNHNGVIDEPGEFHMMNSFMHVGTGFSYDADPNGAESYSDYMHCVWRDHTHLTYGDNGHGGTVETNFSYPGTPYDTGWTMLNLNGTGFGCDNPVLVTCGPFTFYPGQTKSIDFAYVYTRDELNPNGLTTSVTRNLADVKKIKHWFGTNSFPCNNSGIGINEIERDHFDFDIFPNPSSHLFYLRCENKKSSILIMELLDITGRIVRKQPVRSNTKNTIDISNVDAGIYFVRLNDSGRFSIRKLMID